MKEPRYIKFVRVDVSMADRVRWWCRGVWNAICEKPPKTKSVAVECPEEESSFAVYCDPKPLRYVYREDVNDTRAET